MVEFDHRFAPESHMGSNSQDKCNCSWHQQRDQLGSTVPKRNFVLHQLGGNMAGWSVHWTRNPVLLSQSSILAHYLDLFHGSIKFKSLATLVNSQLVCLWPVGIFNNVMFNLNYLFQLFSRPHQPLCYKQCQGKIKVICFLMKNAENHTKIPLPFCEKAYLNCP